LGPMLVLWCGLYFRVTLRSVMALLSVRHVYLHGLQGRGSGNPPCECLIGKAEGSAKATCGARRPLSRPLHALAKILHYAFA
jgi:hypothetical protein